MQTIDDALFDAGRGGFWIDADGRAFPVHAPAEHHDESMRLWGTSYIPSYAAGRIRVSFYNIDEETDPVYVTLALDHAMFEALKTLSQILRNGRLPTQYVGIENTSVDWHDDKHSLRFLDDKGAQHAASWAMREAMIKRLAKAPQPVAA